MKRGAFIVFILAVVLLVPSVSAVDTEVTVKTTPFGNVNLNVLGLGESTDLLARYNEDANQYGDVTFTVSVDESQFDLSVYVKKNDAKFYYEQIVNVKSGEPLYIEAAPDDFEFFYPPEVTPTVDDEENETGENETTVAGETTTEEEASDEAVPGITGQATAEDTGSAGMFSNTALYYILGIVVLGIAVFFATYKVKMRTVQDDGTGGKSKKIKVKKLSEFKEEQKERDGEKFDAYKQALEEAEEKVEKLKREIGKIKSAEKIEELRKKMEEDKKELERLEKGE